MSSIPRKLRIGYRDYTVRISKAKRMTEFGTCDVDTAKIVVNAKQDERTFANTLLHEALHAIYHEKGLHTRIRGEDKEEDIIVNMANGMSEFFRDNPEAVEFFQEKFKA